MASVLMRIIVLAVVLGIEVYFYQAVWTLIKDMSDTPRTILKYTYFFIAGSIITGMVVSAFLPPPFWSKFWRHYFGNAVFVLLLCQLVGLLPLLADDLVRLFRWAYDRFFASPRSVSVVDTADTAVKISRLKFFSYLSVGLAVIPGAALLYGIVKGGHKYKKHFVRIAFPNLPEAFHGMKIIQLSDMHTGSFIDDTFLRKAFGMVLEEKPDMIFFTGDLVNNVASETEGYTDAYRMLKAPMGVYSVLGNHDYGDYMAWEDRDESYDRKSQETGKPVMSPLQQQNLNQLKKVQTEAGWNLLMNENRIIEKNGQKIALLGIENCPFKGQFVRHRYGDLKQTLAGAEDVPFKILLSHDPSHWDRQVSVDPQFKDIDLTLSGHTHGMQMGIEIPGFKWSPVQYIYKQWAGLYKQENQYLYVNRGLGYIGYNGRVGIWPEITVIELYKGERENGYESMEYKKL